MPKWIISWNIGNGPSAEVVEAETEEKARGLAYDAARDEFESTANYTAKPYSRVLAEQLEIE